MRLVLGPDTPMMTEMATTTESSDGRGNKTYHPQRRDDDHITDGLRCALLAIRDRAPADSSPESERYGGWVAVSYGGVGVDSSYTPPWLS